MAWDDVEEDLSRLREDARGALRDVRDLGADLGHHAAVAGDDVVTAEYLVTGTALEWASGWVEDGFESFAIVADQWRLLLADGVDTALALSRAGSIDEFTAIPGDHARRRLAHVREGVERGLGLAERGLERSVEPLRTVWRPFLKMVRDDFR